MLNNNIRTITFRHFNNKGLHIIKNIDITKCQWHTPHKTRIVSTELYGKVYKLAVVVPCASVLMVATQIHQTEGVIHHRVLPVHSLPLVSHK